MNSNTSGDYYTKRAAANALFAENSGGISRRSLWIGSKIKCPWNEADIECLQLSLALKHGYLRVTSPRHLDIEREFYRLCNAARLPKVVVKARGRYCRSA